MPSLKEVKHSNNVFLANSTTTMSFLARAAAKSAVRPQSQTVAPQHVSVSERIETSSRARALVCALEAINPRITERTLTASKIVNKSSKTFVKWELSPTLPVTAWMLLNRQPNVTDSAPQMAELWSKVPVCVSVNRSSM